MITLHITQTEKSVVIPKAEFFELIERYKAVAPVEIVETEEVDDLTVAEIEDLEELDESEPVNFQDAIDGWLKETPSEEPNSDE